MDCRMLFMTALFSAKVKEAFPISLPCNSGQILTPLIQCKTSSRLYNASRMASTSRQDGFWRCSAEVSSTYTLNDLEWANND